MGYSVPKTDISTSGMLAEALASSRGAQVRIVDFAPGAIGDSESIAGRLSSLGDFGTDIEAVGSGSEAIPDYVRALIEGASREAVVHLKNAQFPVDAPLLLDWGPSVGTNRGGRAAAVMSIHSQTSTELRLQASQVGHTMETTRTRGADEAAPLTFGALSDTLASGQQLTVFVEGSDRQFVVIDTALRNFEHGNSRAWLQLVAAGNP